MSIPVSHFDWQKIVETVQIVKLVQVVKIVEVLEIIHQLIEELEN